MTSRAELMGPTDQDRPRQLKRVVRPSGGASLLHQVHTDEGRVRGEFLFHGHSVAIEVPTESGVLFPTDVGMTLLTALEFAGPVGWQDLRVLDIGTGSGLYAVALASAGAQHVVALDVNPACAEVVQINAVRNGIDPLRLRYVTRALGEFDAGGGFDVVVCNPPHFPADPGYSGNDGVLTALVGGVDGRVVYDEVVARADELVAAGGVLVMAHSSLTDIPRTIKEFDAAGFSCQTLLICEMDIPMLSLLEHRNALLSQLYRLRAAGAASFAGVRFEVHVLAFSRRHERRSSEGWVARDYVC